MTESEMRSDLLKNGYKEIEHFNEIRPGVRVRNRGEQYPEAYQHGTATVLVVMRHEGGSWERTYGQPDVEVIVQRDDGTVGNWANYGTRLAEIQPESAVVGSTPEGEKDA